MFYGYTWALRHSVSAWMEDLRWKRENLRSELAAASTSSYLTV
jgi:hypothetical protein